LYWFELCRSRKRNWCCSSIRTYHFHESNTALCGPFDDVIIPKNSVKSDWEVELAFVMGKKASYVDEKNAMEYVAGYCLHNDISEGNFN
jgi:2-keto-4-pentenoate hydratase/2-oxohepta-3-ene-1,7-dioic acid hydratase in catechol pathway